MIGSGGLDSQFALDVQGVQRLRHTASRDPEAGLREAATQFEALFLQMMLKSMREATPRSDLLNSDQTRFYESLMDQQWSQQLAARGTGLAEQLIAQLEGQRRFVATADSANGEQLIAGIPRGAPVGLSGREILFVADDVGAAGKVAPLADADRSATQAPQPLLPSIAPPVVSEQRSAATKPGDAGEVNHVREFIDPLLAPARAASRATGVPAELILAQAALETGWGRYRIAAAGGADSHNLFGIKAGSGWRGETSAVTTHEYIDGKRTRRTDEIKLAESRREAMLLNGPQIRADEPDVVSNQDQVDDLLAELGF